MPRTLTVLGISVLALLGCGLVVLASAGSGNGMRLYGQPYHFILNQLKWCVVAVIALFVAAKFDYHNWKKHGWLTVAAYVVTAILMGVVLLCPPRNGSHRWIPVGGSFVQPSELAKLVVVCSLAVYLDKLRWRVEKFWRGAFRVALLVGVLMALTLAEPDYGALFVMGMVSGVLFLAGGMRWRHFILLGIIGAACAGTALSFNKNRMNRILSWVKDTGALEAFTPLVSASGAGVETAMSAKELAAAHQSDMALVAIRNGGLTGMGFNKSLQKLSYLPEAHTDFIFAIGAEEWGLFFSLLLLALFATFFTCGILIARHAQDPLGSLMAYGVSYLIFFQVLFNIAVVTKSFPTKGIALPFISYGGTNLVAAMVAVGVLFNIGRQIELQKTRPRSTLSPSYPRAPEAQEAQEPEEGV